jgi:hypothetical protein
LLADCDKKTIYQKGEGRTVNENSTEMMSVVMYHGTINQDACNFSMMPWQDGSLESGVWTM